MLTLHKHNLFQAATTSLGQIQEGSLGEKSSGTAGNHPNDGNDAHHEDHS